MFALSSVSQDAARFVREAIELAKTVDLLADVNPHVGAVIVDNHGTVIGRGWHKGAGTIHAEIMALNEAGDKARGATLYCTLEPCNAQGKQSPCSQALIEAGISTVVFAQSDPNSAKAGGHLTLEAAGINVTAGVMADEAQSINSSWTFAHINDRPWIIWKTATTLDGFIAAADGSSQWITGEESRAMVQQLRAHVGAVMTGTGTVLSDNPQLTVRTASHQPLGVVIGTRVIPDDFHLASRALTFSDISVALRTLWQDHGVHRVLVEAGPGLSSSLWEHRLIDEVWWFQAPVILGNGRPAVGDIGVGTLGDALRFSYLEVNRVGLDLVVHFVTK